MDCQPRETPQTESALHCFPAEILGEVFAQTLGVDTIHPSSKTMGQLIDICLVCQGWRNAAIAMHELWQAVELSGVITPQTFDKARRWLERAKTLPKGLAIRVEHVQGERHRQGCRNCWSSSPDFAEALMDATMDLYHLSITCLNLVHLRQFVALLQKAHNLKVLAGMPSTWHSVRSIGLHYIANCRGGPNGLSSVNADSTLMSPIWYLQVLPPVIALSLHLPSVGYEQEDLSPQEFEMGIQEKLGRLKHLVLWCDWLSTGFASKMLDLCRNVENLSLNLDHADYFPDPPYRGVVLPSVRKLYVGWIDRKYVAYEYLQCFKTPVLEELSLEFVENWRNPSDRLGIPERPFTMESVVSMLQQSQCADTLKRVWLHGAHHGDVQHLQIRLPFIRAPHFNVTSYHPKGVVRRTGTWLMTRNL